MTGRDRHEAVTPASGDCAGSGRGHRVVGTWERQSIHDDELQCCAWYVHALPERDRTEEAGTGVGGELVDQESGGVVTLTQDRVFQPLSERFAGLSRSAHGGEQPQGSAACRFDEFRQLVECGFGDAFPPWCGKMFGDVQDAVALVIEWGTHVDSAPTYRLRDVRWRFGG